MFWAILAAAVAVRAGWALYARPEPVSDFADYLKIARTMESEHAFVRGNGEPTAIRLPGYPFFLSLLLRLSDGRFFLGAGNIALAAATCGLLGLFAFNLFRGSRGMALWAMTIYAFYPPLVFYSPVLSSEQLEAFLAVWVLAAVTGPGELTARRLAGCGLLTAAAILTRGSAVVLVPPVLAVAAERFRGAPRALAARAAVFLVAAALPLAAWALRNRLLVGPGVGLSTQGGINFHYAHNPVRYGWRACLGSSRIWKCKEEAEMAREGYRLGWSYIRENPADLLECLRRGAAELYGVPHYGWRWSLAEEASGKKWKHARPVAERYLVKATEDGYAVMAVLILLAVLGFRRMDPRALLPLALTLLGHLIFYGLLFHGAPRYGYPAAVLLCAPAALAPALAAGESKEKRPPGGISG